MTLEKISSLKKHKHPIVKPKFFDLSINRDRNEFDFLVNSVFKPTICDEIESQLIELMKIRFPSEKLTDEKALSLAANHKKHVSFKDYGKWVYYSWLNTLVHILPENEFIEVRTSRNNYKITTAEQEKLSTKKVGVVGLSVGQSIALTMTMERTFGEIRIADFDDLELTNLNRIRAGVQHIGLPKVALVAREIAEIDPYLKVKCFWNGLSEETINDFFDKDGKLDLVADECDDIHMKFLLRFAAKEKRIPVLMDTSDRGMLDIERFDLEPERSVFHGLVDHLHVEGAKHLVTNEDKITYALPIVGINSASTRIKSSMMEIGQTISTWPQLSSDVALGGAISTNVIRRIFLDEFTKSGRYYVDTSEIIPSDGIKKFDYHNFTPVNYPKLENKDLEAEIQGLQLNDNRISIPKNHEEEILRSALSAPSGANCQPWRWVISNNAYYLFHDKHYSISFVDFNDCGAYLALGCAAENFIQSAENLNYDVNLTLIPKDEKSPLKAVFELHRKGTLKKPKLKRNLSRFTSQRLTNRNISERVSLSNIDLKSLQTSVSEIDGAELRLAIKPHQIDELGELISAIDKLRILHPQSHYELFNKEIRFTEEENLKYRDGIDLDLMDLSSAEKVALEVLSDTRVIENLNLWNAGDGLMEISKKPIEAASAIGFITMPNSSSSDFFHGGRAVEKMWLTATELDIAIQPMTVLPYFFNRLINGKGEGFNTEQIDILTHLLLRFNAIFPTRENQGPVFLFRLAKANTPSKLSLRREYNDIIYNTNKNKL